MAKLVVDSAQLPPPKTRDRRNDSRSAKDCKQIILATVRMGGTIEEGCRQANRSRKAYDYYRKTDPDFRSLIDKALQAKIERAKGHREELPDFPDFCERYLRTRLFNHHLQWYDLLEGREPRNLHPRQRFIRGDEDQILVNTPPEHCATLDTPILTEGGWKTVGEVAEGDRLPHWSGQWHPVLRTWGPETEVPAFRVTFGNGDSVTTDAGHKWIVQRSARHPEKLMTTAELMADLRSPSGQLKWRVRQAMPVESPERELFDPYLFGYWLGDGDAKASRFAVGEEDIESFETHLNDRGYEYRRYRDSRGRSWVVYIRAIRSRLPLGNKRISQDYFLGSVKQRMALLRGLMDSDGTISAKDGRARWVQHGRPELCRDVFRLIASLGFQPRMKTYGDTTEVSFKPDAEPVFRLGRKASRQFTRERNRRTDFLTIRNVEPAGRQRVRCLTVLSDDNTYLLGDSLVSTRNAKSTTLTVNYVVWRICQDPNIRILLISKTQDMAKKFLLSIKERLAENEAYVDLQQAFGPPGGFAEGSASWTADKIYVAGRDSGEKDPTVQAVGIGGHIYGSRCDLAIMDDCVDHTNHQQYESQITWIQNQVGSRVADAGGRMVLIGTRMETVDLYSEILKPQYYAEGTSPWTYLTQPAVLEYADKPEDWVTLWPRTNRPPVTIAARKLVTQDGDGLWPMWTGPALAKKRRKMSPRNWSMVYMQDQVADDAVFKMEDVQGCVDRARYPGRLMPGQADHRKFGMDGLVVVAGLDPAAAGCTAMVVVGIDRQSAVRWVLEVVNKRAMPPHEMRSEMKRLTERYNISEWRVEKNAYQGSIVQDQLIREMLAARGCLIQPHHTDAKKWDSDFGVASMAPLFEGWREGRNLVRLPSQTQSEPIRNFIEQLCLVAGTLVETDRGPVPIEEVTTRDLVLTRDGYAPLKWAGQTGKASTLTGIHVQDCALELTPWHRIYDPTRDRFVAAQNVRPGQSLLTLNEPASSRPWPGVGTGGVSSRTGITEGAAALAASSFIGPYGKPTTDPSRTAISSTIGTRTSRTTSSGTSSWSPPANIFRNTAERGGASPRAAKRSLGAARLSGLSSNPAHGSAGSAGLPSRAGQPRLATARSVAERRLSTAVPVYDLTVADGYLPEFFANGVLVHNCSWFPETKGLTDIVMAWWFAEIRCRELMVSDYTGWHMETSEFSSERDRAGQAVIDIDFALQQQGAGAWNGAMSW